jgi:hypothetical protein
LLPLLSVVSDEDVDIDADVDVDAHPPFLLTTAQPNLTYPLNPSM